MSEVSAVRNKEGIFINTQCFREEANSFLKNNYYCPDPIGSSSWFDYWSEQERRCTEGYSVGGVKITGHHYFYLNFRQIFLTTNKVDTDLLQVVKRRKGNKKIIFPDFWDGDYNYFWALDIARNGCTEEELQALQLHVRINPLYLTGGYHMIVGKARRKGYSYKNSSICANIYNTVPDSLTIIGAYLANFLYPKGTMGMTSEVLDFLNKNTGWAKAREFVNVQDHKKASYRESINGMPVEKGYLSQIMAITFKDKPDAARGKDAQLFLFEEAGKFNNLEASFNATKDTTEDGVFTTGQIIIFGTGGDMEGGTVDFANMFTNPLAYDLMPFENIWDEKAERTMCGFFHPDYLNLVGFYDENGNSDIESAKIYENNKREVIRRNASSNRNLQQRMQEHANRPSEAFLNVSVNEFPVTELTNRLNTIKREKLHLKNGTPGILSKTDNKVYFTPDLENKLEPIWEYSIAKNADITGCVIIYEAPIPNAEFGLYKIGHDPYRHDKAENSTSLGATYVYKTRMQGSFSRDIIVASYIGRPNTSDDYNRTLMYLAEFYNAQIGYENEVTEVKSYFQKKKRLDLLAAQPDRVISNNIKNSKVSRVYGVHMPEKLKEAGEKYIKKWLLEEREIDENGHIIMNLDTLYDIGLIEELIKYNRKGNFDRVMAFMILMLYLENEEEDTTYNQQKPIEDTLIYQLSKMYNRNAAR
jgi:hypothetical protein